MTDDNERLEAIEARLDELEAENEQLREENDELHDRVAELETANDELRKENARIKQRVSDLEEQPEVSIEEENPIGSLKVGNAHVGEAITGRVSEYDLENELAELKADLEASNPTPDTGETTGQQHETPLEQVAAMPEHIADKQLTANQQRARFVASNLSDYATRVGSGDYALTAGDLRTVLTAAFDQSHSETVNRVRTILADLGGDAVEIQEPRTAGFKRANEKQSKGKKLIVSASLVRRLEQIDHDVVTGATA